MVPSVQHEQTATQTTRRHRRIAIHLPVTFLSRQMEATHAHIVNVARGGVFVQVDTPLPPDVGSQVTVQFRAMATHLCEARGRVVWNSESDSTAGFGVAFDRTNLAMDVFTRSLAKLPCKMHGTVLANVESPTVVVDA